MLLRRFRFRLPDPQGVRWERGGVGWVAGGQVGWGRAAARALLLRAAGHRPSLLPLPALPPQVGMATGATIHTANGLKVTVERRAAGAAGGAPPTAEPALAG